VEREGSHRRRIRVFDMSGKRLGCQEDHHEQAFKKKHKDDREADIHTVFMECKDCGAMWKIEFCLSEMRGRNSWTAYSYEGIG